MKIKKVLSLMLAMGSLATASSFLTLNAVNAEQIANFKILIKHPYYRAKHNLLYAAKLYKNSLQKGLAPLKEGGTFGAIKNHIKRMANNPNEYKEDIAQLFNLPEDEINADVINYFENICEYILSKDSVSDFRPLVIPEFLDFSNDD